MALAPLGLASAKGGVFNQSNPCSGFLNERAPLVGLYLVLCSVQVFADVSAAAMTPQQWQEFQDRQMDQRNM